MGRKAEDLSGSRFGYLEVLGRSDKTDRAKRIYWACRCECCGTIKDIRGDNLRSGRTITCGCYRKWKTSV